jgi:hypothetical protein
LSLISFAKKIETFKKEIELLRQEELNNSESSIVLSAKGENLISQLLAAESLIRMEFTSIRRDFENRMVMDHDHLKNVIKGEIAKAFSAPNSASVNVNINTYVEITTSFARSSYYVNNLDEHVLAPVTEYIGEFETKIVWDGYTIYPLSHGAVNRDQETWRRVFQQSTNIATHLLLGKQRWTYSWKGYMLGELHFHHDKLLLVTDATLANRVRTNHAKFSGNIPVTIVVTPRVSGDKPYVSAGQSDVAKPVTATGTFEVTTLIANSADDVYAVGELSLIVNESHSSGYVQWPSFGYYGGLFSSGHTGEIASWASSCFPNGTYNITSTASINYSYDSTNQTVNLSPRPVKTRDELHDLLNTVITDWGSLSSSDKDAVYRTSTGGGSLYGAVVAKVPSIRTFREELVRSANGYDIQLLDFMDNFGYVLGEYRGSDVSASSVVVSEYMLVLDLVKSRFNDNSYADILPQVKLFTVKLDVVPGWIDRLYNKSQGALKQLLSGSNRALKHMYAIYSIGTGTNSRRNVLISTGYGVDLPNDVNLVKASFSNNLFTYKEYTETYSSGKWNTSTDLQIIKTQLNDVTKVHEGLTRSYSSYNEFISFAKAAKEYLPSYNLLTNNCQFHANGMLSFSRGVIPDWATRELIEAASKLFHV